MKKFSCPRHPPRKSDRSPAAHIIHIYHFSFFIEKAERHGIARHLAACAFASLWVPACARPLPLQRAAPLRVSSFARTRPQRSWLRHRQAPGRVHICVAVRAPARTPHPAAARGPAEGYFTRANSSAAVPGAYSSQSGVPGFALPLPSAASPGNAFAPLSATVLGSGHAGKYPEICISVK